MNLNDVLPAEGIDALAEQLGVPREQAQQGAQALLPSLLGGMGDQIDSASGNAHAFESQLSALGGGALADNVVGPQTTDVSKGHQVLGNIFGSKDVSRQVASHASQKTGIDPALLKKMLPILAMLVAGHMSKRAGGQQGGLGGVLGSVLGGLTQSYTSGRPAAGGPLSGGIGDILGSILGGRH